MTINYSVLFVAECENKIKIKKIAVTVNITVVSSQR